MLETIRFSTRSIKYLRIPSNSQKFHEIKNDFGDISKCSEFEFKNDVSTVASYLQDFYVVTEADVVTNSLCFSC